MPFVQRVVQPTYLSRLQPTQTTHGAVSGSGVSKFQCIPGKCKNNNCISQQQQQQFTAAARNDNEEAKNSGVVARTSQQQQTTTTTAIVHQPTAIAPSDFERNEICETAQDATDFVVSSTASAQHHSHTNGFASSFSYATDNEDEQHLSSSSSFPLHTKLSGVGGVSNDAAAATAPLLPMKKLKQHVEFLSTSPPTSPNRSGFGIGASHLPSSSSASASTSRHQSASSPSVTKIVTGYEFDSISNITLSNALRQLASLVLIASDIFDDLQQELQNIGERSLTVQRKITVVEQKVCAYDPKLVTVPVSDLLTFAQRKTHYESDKLVRKELFTIETRPCSVKELYEDAGKALSSATSPRSTSFASGDTLNGVDGFVDNSGTGASQAAGSDELVCTPVFGKANRKMRTRIDAEIEIRLPAAIEDLRKWTSTEALGDVTVTPDCMHHMHTSISTSMVIGDNGILTPALSPSVLSADAVDALYSINVSNAANNTDNTLLPNDINKDVPLNHRLPSPEEQCKIIALRYPAELISVDTSGKRFERMCLARKSTTGCVVSIAESNNLNDDVQTVSRRSRSRKVRGKRRNTIAGIDQKEIQDAANGDSTATSGEIKNTLGTVANNADDDAAADVDEDGEESLLMVTTSKRTEKSKKFGRSKSSDILKKESVALPYDKGKSTLTRLNSLKQWGRNRFKFMQRNETSSSAAASVSALMMTIGGSHDTSGGNGTNAQNSISADKSDTNVNGSSKSNKMLIAKSAPGSDDIDDACVVHDLIHGGQKSEGRFSHERKPSYSSSEKSMSVSSSGHLKGKLHLANSGGSGNVKLRDTSSLNRQRRNGITTNCGLSGKDEQPHSSSGNWSASSESGRASIGSEITIQPKSSASNTSLNVSSFHPGSSGPPSSMLSRRRFLNTSASSSVTSEGTATPELQMADTAYNNHLDDETSSAYSCDTEGYYTSFHMDSGLRTLKEEEPPMTPLQIGQNLHTSSYSFGSQSNQTVLTAENEYELYGRGSTSTTTSSAGTVCTTLMVNEHNSCNSVIGPDVPERISSLGKLNRGSHSNSASTSTLERSYSSSTIGSTLERTGTIKRNVNASLKLLAKETEANEIDAQPSVVVTGTPESQEEEFDFEQRIRKRSAQPLPHAVVVAELEYSESSDLEGVERIERIKQKTALNAKRIPSMCIITPSTSDDENHATREGATFDPNKTLTPESSPLKTSAAESGATLQFKVNEITGYCTIDVTRGANGELKIEEAPPTPTKNSESQKDYNLNVLAKRSSNYGFNNVLEKLRVVLPNIKRSPSKSLPTAANTAVVDDDELYDTAGEYVTIADISNNNRRRSQLHQQPKAVGTSLGGLGIYYSNDIVRRRAANAAQQQQQANEPLVKEMATRETELETEYISLNELPYHLRKIEEAFTRNSTNIQSSTKQNDASEQKSSTSSYNNQCAESATSQSGGGGGVVVPMYAEIAEHSRERELISPANQIKGARVKFNAQGRPIYDSDSLKRRKGAHTTFAPGPYVKETESITAAAAASTISSSESVTAKAINLAKSNAANAKLLFLNGAVVAGTPRKVANVRPIVATTPLQRAPNANTTNTNAMSAAGHYNSAHTTAIDYNYTENKNHLANHTNPFFNTGTGGMLPSPSTKSTSSTGSTISSTNSTNTQGSSSTSSSSTSATTTTTAMASSQNKNEDYQHLYRASDHQRTQPVLPYQSQQLNASATALADGTPFQRNAPIYWTLQNRKQASRNVANSATSRDDLYATPIRRSERVARAAATAAATHQSSVASISPIVPRNRSHSVGFLTSTPTQLDSQLPADNIPAKMPSARNVNWDDNSPERLNTCADRIGQSKTSLLDFKKLLLAKSVKSSPVQKKLSAVELLKKSNAANASATTTNSQTNGTLTVNPTSPSTLNSSMKLLDLSGSPKTFANRRMLRQGQFGSPSKSFAPKMQGGGWRGHAAVHRTDIMSTTIPEANSEEDQSANSNNSSSSSSASSKACSETGGADAEERLGTSAITAAEKFNLKRNFFLQTEENNFMKGELKKPFAKTTLLGSAAAPTTTTAAASSGFSSNSNQYVTGPIGCITTAKTTPLTDTTNYVATGQFVPNKSNSNIGNVAHAMPALETAL